MEIVLLTWLICGILAAVIGSNRGDNGIGWFFIGLLLGPIGVIFSFFAKGKQQKELEKAEKGISKEIKICEMCAEAVKAQAKICKHCGHEFSQEQPVKEQAVQEPTETENSGGTTENLKIGIILAGLLLLAVIVVSFSS